MEILRFEPQVFNFEQTDSLVNLSRQNETANLFSVSVLTSPNITHF